MTEVAEEEDLVDEMAQVIEAVCQMQGIKKGTLIASIWATKVRERFGGERRYVSRKAREALAERNAKICREFNGRNLAELAARYELDERQIRNVLKKCPMPEPLAPSEVVNSLA